MKVTGTFLKSEVENKNGRIYSSAVMEKMVTDFKQKQMDGMPMFGEFDIDGVDTSISLINATHEVKDLWIEYDKKFRLPRKLKKKIKNTFGANAYKLFGKKQKATLKGNIEIMENKIPLLETCAFRPRGIGKINHKTGYIEQYELITFDLLPKSNDSWDGIV